MSLPDSDSTPSSTTKPQSMARYETTTVAPVLTSSQIDVVQRPRTFELSRPKPTPRGRTGCLTCR